MDHEAVEHLYEGDRDLTLLDYLLILASTISAEEDESPTEGLEHETSLLGLTLILLYSTLSFLADNVFMTEANYRDITIAGEATYHIFSKLLLDEHVYHYLVDSTLYTLQMKSYLSPTEISSELSVECSMHGVLHNLAVKLIGDIYGLLALPYSRDSNFVNSKLGPILESLNCTLGSLNRALDPVPGGKYAMEAELYNAHLTPHKLPIVPTLISEPKASYCCTGYRQLILK
ncbi:hypothetical protein [Anaplasma bovis]|uniref:hypothetical protein n=1 Tax=Anaplasma bovis TaxID=186733 RepID=UPI002FEF9E94